MLHVKCPPSILLNDRHSQQLQSLNQSEFVFEYTL